MASIKSLITKADEQRREREKRAALRPVVLRLRLDIQKYDTITVAQANYEMSESFTAVKFEDRSEYARFELVVEMLNAGFTLATRKATYKLDGSGNVNNVLMPRTWHTINNLLEGDYNERTRLLIYTRAINYAQGLTQCFEMPAITLNDIEQGAITVAVERDAKDFRARQLATANTQVLKEAA